MTDRKRGIYMSLGTAKKLRGAVKKPPHESYLDPGIEPIDVDLKSYFHNLRGFWDRLGFSSDDFGQRDV